MVFPIKSQSRLIVMVILTLAGTVKPAPNTEDLADGKYFSTYSFIPTALASNINQKCIDDSRAYVDAILNHEQWAQSSQ